jgi:SAM-dependent methyltransferase
MDEIDRLKQRDRAMWSAGDYEAIALPLRSAGVSIVERTAIGPGDDVLDVACGTGNAAIAAAQAGGHVTGVDLTPALMDQAAARAAELGVDITLVEGDAEALPFADASFDVVLSTFGCMFGPRHELSPARSRASSGRPEVSGSAAGRPRGRSATSSGPSAVTCHPRRRSRRRRFSGAPRRTSSGCSTAPA